jgi:uncharacterized membrane protein YkoI
MSTNLLNKKVIIVAIIAAGAVAAVFAASSVAQTTAQQQKMMWASEGMPQINGSVSVANETASFISENVRVPFVTAAETAQGQVDGGTVFGGHLGVVQGYLVYMFFVANTANQTGHMIIVDAGNGEVLYASEGHPMGSMAGHFGGHGGWHGPGKAHDWGMWR